MAADVAKLSRRLEQLRTQRSTIEEVWKQCFSYTYPLRGIGFFTQDALGGASLAKAFQAAMTDSTGTDGTRILGAALLSGLTPSSQRWPVLDVDGVSDGSKQWLDESADLLWENIHQSNYDAVAFDAMLDMAIAGEFALFCDTDRELGGYVFEQWPLASTYFASTKLGGPVDTVFNEHQLSAEQLVKDYGENMVSEKVFKAYQEKPDEQFTVVRCIYPRTGAKGSFAKNLPIASIHFEKDSKKLLRESGYHEMPVGVPRWSVVPGTAYSFGPVFDALPDIKTLNKEVEFVLQNADMAIAGMWIAEDDGVLNAKSIKIGPRKVIVANSVDSMKALQPAGKFDIAALDIDRLQRAIRKVLMADQLTPQDGPALTATEVSVRVELIRQQLGPVYSRMQSEFLQWLINRTFGLAYRAGVFGQAPEELQDKTLSIKYNTPIARSQKAQDVAAMDRYELSLGQQAQVGLTDAIDCYKWDDARRKRAELLGVPASLIPDQDDIDASRAQKKEQMQQAQSAQMMATAMGAPQ